MKLKDQEKRDKKLKEAEHKATVVYHMVNLGFQGGTRASEFTNLRVRDVIWSEGLCLCILTSKTGNGIRMLPLYLIASDRYLQAFIKYFRQRKSEALNGEEWLFPDYEGRQWDSSHLSSESIRLFEEIGIHNMRFQHLRHGFANWFLLRWFIAFHGEFIPDDLPILENEFFNEPYVSRFRNLFLGMNAKKGQEVFTHALAVLARLIGHGGPIVTLKNYIHTGDWIFYLLSKRMEVLVAGITSQQAQEFLQVSYPSLPQGLKGRGIKKLSFNKLLEYQKGQLHHMGKGAYGKTE
jgi:hypothetical protein